MCRFASAYRSEPFAMLRMFCWGMLGLLNKEYINLERSNYRQFVIESIFSLMLSAVGRLDLNSTGRAGLRGMQQLGFLCSLASLNCLEMCVQFHRSLQATRALLFTFCISSVTSCNHLHISAGSCILKLC